MSKHGVVGASARPHCNTVHDIAVASNDGVHVTITLDGVEVLHVTVGQ